MKKELLDAEATPVTAAILLPQPQQGFDGSSSSIAVLDWSCVDQGRMRRAVAHVAVTQRLAQQMAGSPEQQEHLQRSILQVLSLRSSPACPAGSGRALPAPSSWLQPT